MKHRILALLLAVTMVLALVPVGVSAEEDNPNVITYGSFFFNTNTGEVLGPTTTSVTTLTIPKTIEDYVVRKIADKAFSGCKSLTEVTIANSVVSIGAESFENCVSLQTVTIQDGADSVTIGRRAFANIGIASIVLPNSVSEIGDNAFADCSNLASVAIPSTTKTLKDNAFYNCSRLNQAAVSSNTTVEGDPFYLCGGLKIIHYVGTSEPTWKANLTDKDIEIHLSKTNPGESLDATCTVPGFSTEKISCPECKRELFVITRYTSLEDHTEAILSAKEATCTSSGLTEGKECSECHTVLVRQEVINPIEHTKIPTKSDETVDPSCEDGSITKFWKCDVCGFEGTTVEILQATGIHVYTKGEFVDKSQWIELKGVTCTEEGTVLKPRVCDVCGKAEEIEKDHIEEHKKENYACAEGHVVEDVSALGHALTEDKYEVVEKPDGFDCKDGGTIKVIYWCTRCESYIRDSEDDVKERQIPAGEHVYNEPEKLPESEEPTCEKEGKLVTQRTCTVCGYKEDPVEEVLPATGHTITEWKIVTPATCTKEGTREGECETCKETITEKIEPLGHDFESDKVTEEVIKEASCTEAGSKYLICGREDCDGINNKKEVEIEILPHKPLAPEAGTVLKEPTCTDEGSKVYNTRCSVCGTDLQNIPIAIPALGHDFGPWSTSGGVRTRTCQREGCGYKETDASNTPSNPSNPSEPSTPSTSTSYAVDVIRPANGTITVSTSSARAGTTVTVTLRPNSGYQLDSVQVTRGGSGRVVSLSGNGSNRYTFTMPASRVEVRAVFSTVSGTSTNTTAPSTYNGGTPTKNIVVNIPQIASASTPAGSPVFVDVPSTFWASGEITWACQRGFISGSGGSFYPDNLITVRQVWMIMARMMGQNPANMEEARVWAINNGFASGANPNAAVTRLQLATMLYRLARLMGSKNVNTTNLGIYVDSRNVPEASKNAMAWAVANGIITGNSENRLNPNETVSRAQCCVILYRFYQRLF